MTRPRAFALLLAATAFSTVWVGPVHAQDPSPSSLVLQNPPAGFTKTTVAQGNGPLDLDKAVAFLGNAADTRKDLVDDKFTGGHVTTYVKGTNTALLSAVFVFGKPIPGKEFVTDAKKSLQADRGQVSVFDPGIPDAVGVSAGQGETLSHIVLFAKRNHAFLDVAAGPGLDQNALRDIVKAHHAQVASLEPAAKENPLTSNAARIGAVVVVAAVAAAAVAKLRPRKAATTPWGTEEVPAGEPLPEGGETPPDPR